MIHLERTDDVFVLHMQAGENRFNRPFLDAMGDALDQVEAAEGPAALVTTGQGKFYSNGLDLEWLSEGHEDMARFVIDVERLFSRMLTLPMITVAAVNGHCFAAGAMLALCHDFRIMRSDRGFFCLPEVDIKIPFTAGMNSLILRKLPLPVAHEAMVTGKRYGGDEAAARGIVDREAPEENVLSASVAIAQELAGKDRATIRTIKQRMYAETIELLEASRGTAPLEG